MMSAGLRDDECAEEDIADGGEEQWWDLDDDDDDDPGGFEFFPYYSNSRPRGVRGGIKARSGRGSFGRSWWARRWVETLESFNVGSRLSRGRAYARRGQVTSIDIAGGLVTARVQGSRSRPYKVKIRVKPLTRRQRRMLADSLSRRPILLARLLAGEMPEDIGEVFREAGVSPFPEGADDLTADCSCPDWMTPCKHIAAVHYLLAEELDRDAFLVFRLRGIERGELADLAGGGPDRPPGEADPGGVASPPASPPASASGGPRAPSPAAPPAPPPGLSPAQSEVFQRTPGPARGGEELPDDWDDTPLPTGSPLEQLGSFPFWRGREDLLSVLEEVQHRASPVGLAIAEGRLSPPSAREPSSNPGGTRNRSPA